MSTSRRLSGLSFSLSAGACGFNGGQKHGPWLDYDLAPPGGSEGHARVVLRLITAARFTAVPAAIASGYYCVVDARW
uniref:Putative secreted peptide n=1 Tax=Anopheles braziliensis TaxID=58242 RepID=A0A2M3ZV31_9DIPT